MIGEIVFLGTSGSMPSKDRGLPGILVKIGGLRLLLDAGEGVQQKMIMAGESLVTIDVIIITHLHGDHFFGLPGLLHSMNINRRVKELSIIGPRGIRDFITKIYELTYSRPVFHINICEIAENAEERINLSDDVWIKLFPVNHSIPAFGVLLAYKKKKGRINAEKALKLGIPRGPLWSKLQHGEPVLLGNGRVVKPEDVLEEMPREYRIVYTGDTAPSDKIVEESRGADILIHESTFASDKMEEAHEFKHSTSIDAAITASRAGVKTLVLTHFSTRYKDVSLLVEEARRFFINTIAAEDLMKLPLI